MGFCLYVFVPEAGAALECSLDSAAFAARNPENGTLDSETYDNLGDGKHAFLVRATDQAANADSSSALLAAIRVVRCPPVRFPLALAVGTWLCPSFDNPVKHS